MLEVTGIYTCWHGHVGHFCADPEVTRDLQKDWLNYGIQIACFKVNTGG